MDYVHKYLGKCLLTALSYCTYLDLYKNMRINMYSSTILQSFQSSARPAGKSICSLQASNHLLHLEMREKRGSEYLYGRTELNSILSF